MQPGEEGEETGRSGATPRSRRRALGEGRRWFSEPRSAVLIVLGGVLALGGGWRLLRAWKDRRTIARLGDADVTPAEVEAAADAGRGSLPELFRLLVEAPSADLRTAAGRGIATLWGRDDLIAEEEQALVRRAYEVTWRARRTYPRLLRAEIPIEVRYGVTFLPAEGTGIAPENLEWSHRLIGSRRAALEEFSSWKAGAGRYCFSLIPDDFGGNGPHRLALQTRVRTARLTTGWELALPAIPFSFEFDPRLEVASLLTLPDAGRERALSRAISLQSARSASDDSPRFLHLNDRWSVRHPPDLVVATTLPCDLAHRASLEIDGAGRFDAGTVVLGGQGGARGADLATGEPRFFSVELSAPLPPNAIERPGPRRVRAVLEPDPELGWIDPDVRSIWPGKLITEWVEVEVVRR